MKSKKIQQKRKSLLFICYPVQIVFSFLEEFIPSRLMNHLILSERKFFPDDLWKQVNLGILTRLRLKCILRDRKGF